MSGIWEVFLWRAIGKNIRNNSENCHIVGIDQIINEIRSKLNNYEDSEVWLKLCY